MTTPESKVNYDIIAAEVADRIEQLKESIIHQPNVTVQAVCRGKIAAYEETYALLSKFKLADMKESGEL